MYSPYFSSQHHSASQPSATHLPAATTSASPTSHVADIALPSTDSRPATSHAGDVEDMIDDEDDQSGGVSLADFQQFMEAQLPSIHDMETETDDAVASPHSLTAQIQSWSSHAAASTLDLHSSPALYHLPGAYIPAHPISMSHLSSSEHSLEPPPALQDPHLSIQDKASFAPITSFFHWFTPQHPVVPGLDLVVIPDSITRDDLQGDQYDFQGIDWAARNTTRSAVRAKRVDYEKEKVLPSQKEIRKVGIQMRMIPFSSSYLDSISRLLLIQTTFSDSKGTIPNIVLFPLISS